MKPVISIRRGGADSIGGAGRESSPTKEGGYGEASYLIFAQKRLTMGGAIYVVFIPGVGVGKHYMASTIAFHVELGRIAFSTNVASRR